MAFMKTGQPSHLKVIDTDKSKQLEIQSRLTVLRSINPEKYNEILKKIEDGGLIDPDAILALLKN